MDKKWTKEKLEAILKAAQTIAVLYKEIVKDAAKKETPTKEADVEIIHPRISRPRKPGNGKNVSNN